MSSPPPVGSSCCLQSDFWLFEKTCIVTHTSSRIYTSVERKPRAGFHVMSHRKGCCEPGRAPLHAALASIPWHPSRLVPLRFRTGPRRLSLDWDRSLLGLNFFSKTALALKEEFFTQVQGRKLFSARQSVRDNEIIFFYAYILQHILQHNNASR